jgi:hypothetical protein
MKKILVFSVLMLLLTISIYAQSRAYMQKVVAHNGLDLLTIVTETGASYTAPNYLITAQIIEVPTEVLQTGVTATSNLRLARFGNGSTVPYYAGVYIQLGAFSTQWVAGETLHVIVTKTDITPNQMTEWDYVIPTGTATISIIDPVQNIPPLLLTPVWELTSFTGLVTPQMTNMLQWTLLSEFNLQGFWLMRANEDEFTNSITINPSIIPASNTLEEHNYSFNDINVVVGQTYFYWLEVLALNGDFIFTGPIELTTTSIPQIPPVQKGTFLANVFPNPFNESTSTNIVLSVKNGENATLSIYNIRGQLVKNYALHPGSNQEVQWNGKDDKGSKCSSGIYFCKLSSETSNSTRKIMIIK